MWKLPDGKTLDMLNTAEWIAMLQYYIDHYPDSPEKATIKTFAQSAVADVEQSGFVDNDQLEHLAKSAQERANAQRTLLYIGGLVFSIMSRYQQEFTHALKQAVGYYNANAYWQSGWSAGYGGFRGQLSKVSARQPNAQTLYDRGYRCAEAVKRGLPLWDNGLHEIEPWIHGYLAGEDVEGWGSTNPYSLDDPGHTSWAAGWATGDAVYTTRCHAGGEQC